MGNGLPTGVTLLDFSVAFDLVNHNILLLKLRNYNFSENDLNWIQSYLTTRSMTVYINGAYSEGREMYVVSHKAVVLAGYFLVYLSTIYPLS